MSIKMRFRLLSDLHLEFRKNDILSLFDKIKNFNMANKVDYLILAGDITNFKNLPLLEKLFNFIKDDYKKIFYVLGNHEYYDSNKKDNVLVTYKNMIKSFDDKIILLENESFDLDSNTVISGATLWTDIKLEDCGSTNDTRYIRWDEISEAHFRSKNFLKELQNNKKHIIVTHHMPSLLLIDKKYSSYSSAGFASNCEDIFTPNMLFWLHGHTHTPNNTMIKGINFISNPAGYPGENEFYNDCIFVIN